MGSASRSLSGNQAEKVVFNGSPSESSGPQSAKPGLFSAGEPASAFEGSTGVVAGTGSLIKRRWSGGGGGRQLGPGIVGSRSSPGAVFVEQVSAPVCLGESESTRCGVGDFDSRWFRELFHDAWTSLVLVPRMIFTMRRSSSLVLLVLQLAILRLVRLVAAAR